MKTKLKMDEILAGYIGCKIYSMSWIDMGLAHWDCQDTEEDGEIECYFYIKSPNVHYYGVDKYNKALADILGVEPTDMIEDDAEMGHEGEYRFEYIVSLKSEETID